MIEINGVVAGYDRHGKEIVLDGIDTCFEEGRLICIIGKNGCGKTTLLKTVIGALKPLFGSISVDSQPLDKMSTRERAGYIAYLSQGGSIPDMTAFEAVLHGRFSHLSYPRRYTKKDKELAMQAMEKTGTSGYAEKMMSELSGGMRQRVYIAMALCQNAQYILMDEPLTYLDAAGQLELMRTLKTLAEEDRGVIAVMHDLPLAFTFADKITVLHNGRIAYSGVPCTKEALDTVNRVLGVTLIRNDDGSYRYKYI